MASVLHGSARTTPRLRAELQASKESSPGPCRPLRPEREDGAQMAQADHDGRRAHGSEDAEEHGADAGRGSHRGGVPAEDAAAAGRCAGLPEGRHPQPQPQRPAPLPAAPWHLPACRVEETTGAAQDGSRPTRSATSTSTAANCATPTASWSCSWPSTGSRSSPTSSSTTAPARWKAQPSSERRGGLPLQDPHRAHRQRHGLRRPAQEPGAAPAAASSVRTSSIASAWKTASSTG